MASKPIVPLEYVIKGNAPLGPLRHEYETTKQDYWDRERAKEDEAVRERKFDKGRDEQLSSLGMRGLPGTSSHEQMAQRARVNLPSAPTPVLEMPATHGLGSLPATTSREQMAAAVVPETLSLSGYQPSFVDVPAVAPSVDGSLSPVPVQSTPLDLDLGWLTPRSPAQIFQEYEKPRSQFEPVPVGENASGQPMVQMGLSEPSLAERTTTPRQQQELQPMPGQPGVWYQPAYDEPGEMPDQNGLATRLSGGLVGTPYDEIPRLTVEDLTPERFMRDQVMAPLMTASNVGNDLYTRFANARTDYAPEPVYEWETPTSPGKPFRVEDITSHWKIRDKVYTEQEMSETVDLQDGTVRLPDGIVVPMAEYDSGPFVYSAFPDGTVLEYGDGREPEEAGRIHKRQVNETGILGIAEPRLPWQDTAGNVPILDPDFDASRMVGLREGVPASVDLLLGSAPYMTPKPVRYGLAAAQSLPYLFGYDTSTYEPAAVEYRDPETGEMKQRPSRGFENLDRVGDGRYQAGDLSWTQRLAGAAQPFIDAYVEDISGSKIGGFENLPGIKNVPGIGKFLGKNLLTEALSAGLMEGLEEVPSVLPGALTRDGISNLWKDSYWDSGTDKLAYRDTPLLGRVNNALREYGNATGAGFTMGAETSLGQAPMEAAFSRLDRGRYREANGYEDRPKPEGQE